MTSINIGNLYRIKFLTGKPNRDLTLSGYYADKRSPLTQAQMVNLFIFLDHIKYLAFQREMFYSLYNSGYDGIIFKYETSGHII